MVAGGYEVTVVEAGAFRLDGGGLFGVVPWTMWREKAPPDESNRVRVSTTCLLLTPTTGGGRVLIETGYGDKLDARSRAIYGVENPGGILAAMAKLGIQPESIEAIVVTHLHFDHVGGATTTDGSGRPASAFPNARLFVQRGEWEDALANFSHMRATYLPENLQPLADGGGVELVDGPSEILPDVRVEPAPGHTRGHQVVLVGDGGPGTLCFAGDLVPTLAHLRPFWTTSYDIEPAVTNATRQRIVSRAIDGGWVVVFPHDTQTPAVRVGADDRGRWVSEPVEL